MHEHSLAHNSKRCPCGVKLTKSERRVVRTAQAQQAGRKTFADVREANRFRK